MGWIFVPYFELDLPPIRKLECSGGPLNGRRVEVGPDGTYHWDVTAADGGCVRHTYTRERTPKGVILAYVGSENLPPPPESGA